jgi:putative acetyltransferase
MIRLIRTNSDDPEFKKLVSILDSYLTIMDGDEHPFYDQFNKLDMIRNVLMAYDDDTPVGCGAIKQYDSGIYEIKRMFTVSERRGEGIASAILDGLEKWASELSAHKCILETGKRQQEAVILYTKRGYKLIANYGPYKEVENSLCFEKSL